MKKRNDFVTNSSSSSFVIDKHYLSEVQLEQIKEHMRVAAEIIANDDDLNEEDLYLDQADYWDIVEESHQIKGRTFMDNFDMSWFLDKIGVSRDKINWSNY